MYSFSLYSFSLYSFSLYSFSLYSLYSFSVYSFSLHSFSFSYSCCRSKAQEADDEFEAVGLRLTETESNLERAEERADVGETKIIELEEELRVVANNLKSLEVTYIFL